MPILPVPVPGAPTPLPPRLSDKLTVLAERNPLAVCTIPPVPDVVPSLDCKVMVPEELEAVIASFIVICPLPVAELGVVIN